MAEHPNIARLHGYAAFAKAISPYWTTCSLTTCCGTPAAGVR